MLVTFFPVRKSSEKVAKKFKEVVFAFSFALMHSSTALRRNKKETLSVRGFFLDCTGKAGGQYVKEGVVIL